MEDHGFGSARLRAAQGAEWLDDFRPGWASEIDVAALDIKSDRLCVLGQLYGSFELAPVELDDTVVHHGFAPVGYNSDWYGDAKELTAAWRDLVAARVLVTVGAVVP